METLCGDTVDTCRPHVWFPSRNAAVVSVAVSCAPDCPFVLLEEIF